jgi:hypothetical protein
VLFQGSVADNIARGRIGLDNNDETLLTLDEAMKQADLNKHRASPTSTSTATANATATDPSSPTTGAGANAGGAGVGGNAPPPPSASPSRLAKYAPVIAADTEAADLSVGDVELGSGSGAGSSKKSGGSLVDEDIINAAKASNAHDFILNFPKVWNRYEY